MLVTLILTLLFCIVCSIMMLSYAWTHWSMRPKKGFYSMRTNSDESRHVALMQALWTLLTIVSYTAFYFMYGNYKQL